MLIKMQVHGAVYIHIYSHLHSESCLINSLPVRLFNFCSRAAKSFFSLESRFLIHVYLDSCSLIMYRRYMNFFHSYEGGFKVCENWYLLEEILWFISVSSEVLTCMYVLYH